MATSHELIESLSSIMNLLSNKEDFSTLRANLAITYNKYNEMLQETINYTDNNSIINMHSKAKNVVNSVSNYTDQISIWDFYTVINEIKKDISCKPLIIAVELENITKYIDNYATSFEKYVRTKTINEALDLTRNADILQTFINELGMYYKFTVNNLENTSHLSNEYEILTILFKTSVSLNDFIGKLKSIENIYKELCFICNINDAQDPIQIIKIESGSMFTKVTGNRIVMTTMSSILMLSAGYIHRNFTNEGKITAIPKKADALNKILELRNKLKKAGIDTKIIDDNIGKSSTIIANELNNLLLKEPVVEINGTKYDVGDDLHKKYIEHSKTKLIEDKGLSENELVSELEINEPEGNKTVRISPLVTEE